MIVSPPHWRNPYRGLFYSCECDCSFLPLSVVSGVSCTDLTYRCKNNKCINKVNPECDGTQDCEDGSDEENCGMLQQKLRGCSVFWLTSRTSDYLHLHCHLAWQNRCELPPTSGITTSCCKPALGLTVCLRFRLRQEYVQVVTYCGWSGCRGRGVSLAGQPPCQKLRSRVRSIYHQSTLAGHRCPLCARWRQNKVTSYFMLYILTGD